MPSIDSIAADYVERAAVLDPAFATWAGIAGHDDELPDLSADGFAGRAELDRSALAALETAETPGLREQVARAAMQERLAVAVERYDAGDTTSELNVIDSWVQYVRELFDLMPTEGEESAVNIASRMAAVPEAYRQLVQSSGLLLFRAGGAAHRGSGLAARGAGRGRPRGHRRHRRARCLPRPGTGQQPHPARSHPGGGRGGPGRRPGPAHRRAGELPRLDAGAGRAHHLGAERQALRHPGARATDRGRDRPRQQRRDLLHRTFGGLVPARADVVVRAGRYWRLHHLEGGHDRLPPPT